VSNYRIIDLEIELEMLNAILHVPESGYKWRCLPKEFGNWHTIYVRLKWGVADQIP
jgi:transposase